MSDTAGRPEASKNTLAASLLSLYADAARGRALQKAQHVGLTRLALDDPEPHFAAWVQANGKPYANNAVEYSTRQATWLENLKVRSEACLHTLFD